jgi:3-oxoacyl-[acyl-carrier protein] reductase
MQNKTVLVTGISRGIGKELALAFAQAGWSVCGCYKTNKPDFSAYRHSEKRSLGECSHYSGESQNRSFYEKILSFQADISNPEEAKSLIEKAQSVCGSIDCLINNASIGKNKILFKETPDNWNEVIQTNLNGTFYVLKYALDFMAKRRRGTIINIASISAFKSYAGAASYSASKAAVIAVTKTAAREGGRFGVCVNAVLPGFHLTSLGASAGEKYIEERKRESVLNVTTDMNELLTFALWLAQTKTISGQVFNIDSRII